MIAQYLWIAGSLPFIILGTIHLLYTFFTNKFSSRDPQVDEKMKACSPVLTRQTTMWKAWTGFNGSHSAGAMYFGLINIFVAIRYVDGIRHPLLVILNLATVVFYLFLAKKFWFRIPFTGILISLACFIAATIVIVFD